MSRLGMVCAGLALLAAVGCVEDSFLTRPFGASKYRQFAEASPSLVSAVLQEGFGGVGIAMLSKRHGEEVRLAGQTRTGEVFCVYVRPATEGATSRSVVTVKWDGRPDEQLWQSVLGWLAACAPKDDSAKGS